MSDRIEMPSDFSIQIAAVEEPCPAHSHDFLELAYIRRGWTQHSLEGQSRTLTEGDFILVDFDEVHSYDVVGGGLEAVNCMFRPAAVDSALGHCRSFSELLDSCLIGVGYACGGMAGREKIFRDETGRVRDILGRLLEESSRQEIGYYPVVRALLVELIIQTVRLVRDRRQSPGQLSIAWILDEVSRDPAADHRLTRYASRFGMRPEALSRLFRQQAGLGFSEHLRRSRIQLACRLLVETGLSIPEVAEHCGYLDAKSFREAFLREMGQPPLRWKKNACRLTPFAR